MNTEYYIYKETNRQTERRIRKLIKGERKRDVNKHTKRDRAGRHRKRAK